MPAYVTLGTNQLEKARAFYDALMAEIGLQPLFDHGSGGRVYGDGKTMVGIDGPFNQQPATTGNGTMDGFAQSTPQVWDRIHATIHATDERYIGASDSL